MSVEVLLKVTPEERKNIKKLLGWSDIDVQEQVKILKEWIKKQAHLPYEEADLNLEHVLQLNKFSLEKSKRKIDMFYTIRTLVPEFFVNRDLFSPQMKIHLDNIIFSPLPMLTEDLCRVQIYKLRTNDADIFDMVIHANFMFSTADFRYMYDDKCVSEIYILDFGNVQLGHVIKHTPVIMKKMMVIIEKAYSDRIKAVHFVNTPPYASVIINMMNALLSKKLANRVYNHKTYESLHKMVSKYILPVDYGGTEKPLEELSAKWRAFTEKHNTWITNLGLKKSNESLRQGTPVEGDFFGSIDGSFRQLNVD